MLPAEMGSGVIPKEVDGRDLMGLAELDGSGMPGLVETRRRTRAEMEARRKSAKT